MIIVFRKAGIINYPTIVPLRPCTAKANILPEQTLGLGLRRMTYPGGPHEILTVVEHRAFVQLYEDQLGEEGSTPTVVDVEKVPKITVSIFPDGEHKDLNQLDMLVPSIFPRLHPHSQAGRTDHRGHKKAVLRLKPPEAQRAVLRGDPLRRKAPNNQ